MWEEKLRKVLLALFFVSLCLPVAIQQATLGVLLAFLAYTGWRNKGLPATPLDRPLLWFFAALLLSTLMSPDVTTSLAGYRKLWLVGAFFVTYRLVREPQEAERLVSLLVMVATAVAAYGIVQHFTGLDLAKQLLGKEPNVGAFWFGREEGFRTKGLFPSGITYAHNVLFPLTFLTTQLFAPVLPWPRRLVLLGGWGLMVFALLFSLTRGVWLAYTVVIVLLGVTRGGKALLAVGACAVLLGVSLVGAGLGVRERAAQVFTLKDNLGRSQIWQANLDMIRERPLLGWGYGNYKKFRDPYYQRYPAADTTAHAHNNFLQMWVDGGLIGVGAFLFLFWVILHAGWQAYRLLPAAAEPLHSLALGGALGVAGFLLGGLTQYNFGDAEVVIVLWATAGVVMRVREWAEERTGGRGSGAGENRNK
ncbi:MAG: O-antigen ligase family protein [Deltaproteobacteria bacterium]|nr:O-antigen ligase family protein [Deltaproteobacteria bacterium]